VLADLPAVHWATLLRAVRRAADRMERSTLPAALRPFAAWKPERLAGERPRRTIAAALAADPRLREEVGRALDDGLYAAAQDADTARLVATYGLEEAVAGLAARARWEDLAVVAATSAQRLAASGRVAAETARRQETADDAAARRRRSDDLAAARSDRDAHRRRADRAEQRERRAESERRRLAEHSAQLERRLDELSAELEATRARAARQEARLRQRVAEATRRASIDADRVTGVADRLARLGEELRSALEPDGRVPAAEVRRPADAEPGPAQPGAENAEARAAEAAPARLRRPIAAAAPGRPCRLPPGVREDEPLGVESLLLVPGIAVVLDGYNVTKDAAGAPLAPLPEQRAWLTTLAGGVNARFGARVTVVFDGTEEFPAPTRTPRGVNLVFSVDEETADLRIVALVEGMDPSQPVLVVTSDREVRDACHALGANVTPSGAFLRLLRP
jgi:hypothetical protein